MARAVAAVILLAIVIAVGYLKIVRQETRVSAARVSARQENSEQIADLKRQFESERQELTQQQNEVAESLLFREYRYCLVVDSLTAVADSRQEAIDSLAAELAEKNRQPKQGYGEVEILRYYRQRYEKLPEDLSEYERRVAISEIRRETASKFSISVQELNRIREKNRLTY